MRRGRGRTDGGGRAGRSLRARLAGCFAAASAVLLAAALAGQAAAQSGGLGSFFIDPEDHHLDVSALLARGGFIPMPIIITEPAVDNGFGIAGYFVRKPEGRRTPTRTIFGAAKTGNGSKGGGFFRSGAFGDDRFLYQIGFAQGLAVLDFYPGNRDVSLTYNNDITFAVLRGRYRFGDTRFSLGPALRYRSNDISLDTGGRFPDAEDFAGTTVVLPSVALEAHYDNRDNPMSPTRGLNVAADVQSFSEALGSDIGFTSASVFGTWFASRDKWTLGLMGDGEATGDRAPFFMRPDVEIRGVARNRYQGEQVAMAEAELRRELTPRWSALGFLGHGRTFGDGASEATGYGVGIRYRIARLLGLDVGIDYARGPDQDVFYIQFGHAWSRKMD